VLHEFTIIVYLLKFINFKVSSSFLLLQIKLLLTVIYKSLHENVCIGLFSVVVIKITEAGYLQRKEVCLAQSFGG
jgi:hypothetical protein